MISVEWKKQPLNKFYSKMDKIVKGMDKSAKEGVQNALKSTQRLALQIKPSGSGQSDQGVLIELMEGNEIKGRVYTDSSKFPYLVYLEFGTGLYADPEGGGSRAKKIPWYVHTSMADLSRYGYQVITMGEEQFYVVWGMKAHPFMRPAGFQNRDTNIELLEKEISDMIGRVLK
jgi:HK97 gp10 family phage protein